MQFILSLKRKHREDDTQQKTELLHQLRKKLDFHPNDKISLVSQWFLCGFPVVFQRFLNGFLVVS